MIVQFANFAQPFSFDRLQQIVVVNGAIGRLLTACLLGGLIGLEREVSRKAAGVRTNLLICMGAAFFTLFPRCWPEMPAPTRDRWHRILFRASGSLAPA